MINLTEIGINAKKSSRLLSIAPIDQRNNVLRKIGQLMMDHQQKILAANTKDVENARSQGLNEAIIDRLLLTPSRLEGIVADISKVIELPDPLGEVFESQILPNGITYIQSTCTNWCIRCNLRVPPECYDRCVLSCTQVWECSYFTRRQ